MSYRVPERLAWLDVPAADEEPSLYLAHVPDGAPLVLKGTARAIWLTALESRDSGEVLTGLSRDLGVPARQVAPDVASFLAELGDQGLLEEVA